MRAARVLAILDAAIGYGPTASGESLASKKRKKLKPSYQSIRKPMAPPSRTIDSKRRPRVREKKVDLRKVDYSEFT